MVLWGFWALIALVDPSFVSPAHLAVAGLALVAAALLLIAVAAVPVRVPRGCSAGRAFRRTEAAPRLIDPDAAGRPRPRAPAAVPAAALVA